MGGDDGVYRLKADAEYFQAIEDHFRKLRGTHLLLSPRDNPMIDSWWESGIPLEVVLRALDSVFRRRREAGDSRPVLSLGYCRHAVEESFRERQESRVGAGSSTGAPDAGGGATEAAQLLDERAREIRTIAAREPAAAATLNGAAAELDALAARLREAEPPTLGDAESELEQMETRLLGALLDALPPEESAEMRAAAERDLSDLRARLTERAWEGSLRNRLHARLRERTGLPHLTLYFL